MMSNGKDRARFGPFAVDLHTHELWKFGTRLKLVGQPFEILAFLLRRAGELVTREELRERLWPADTFVDFNHGLNAAVNKLREALSDSAENPRYVETLPRRGYRFIAAIEWQNAESTIPAAPAIVAPIAAAPTSPILPPQTLPGSLPQKQAEAIKVVPARREWFPFVLGAGLLFAILFAVKFVLRTASGQNPERSEQALRSLMERTRPLTPAGGTAQPAFSPDGNSVAVVREGAGGIFVASIGSDQLLQLTNGEGDCCPAWSPDGRFIAFSRFADKKYSLYVIPADGWSTQKRADENALHTESATFTLASASPLERKLDTTGITPRSGEVSWSPDNKMIAFAGGSGIYLLSLEDSTVRRITEAPPIADDWGPTFSPDGQRVLFVRNHQVGLPNEIRVTNATGGDSTRVISEPGTIEGPPQWSFDGYSVIYASNRTGHPALWRVSLDAPDAAVQVAADGAPAWNPAVSRRGYRLAYDRQTRNLSIWQMDLATSGEKHSQLLVSSTSDTDQGPGPQFSPDGKKLAYMSDHSGTMEIWVSNRDGSNPYQLTAVGGAGTPRWSPDSKSVAFDVNTSTGSRVAFISLAGGAPKVVSPEQVHAVCPSWSRDGKWIYFASTETREWQVWKVPAAGGTPVQVTQHGGHAPLESLDGKALYYAKTPMNEPEVWQMPVDGGPETVLPLVRPGTWASWQVVEGGIVFVGPSLGHRAVVSRFDFATRRTTMITVLDRVPFWLGASPDGETVAFDQPGQEEAQTMLIENFH